MTVRPRPAASARGDMASGLGVQCSLCCGSLMLALLAMGMMNLDRDGGGDRGHRRRAAGVRLRCEWHGWQVR